MKTVSEEVFSESTGCLLLNKSPGDSEVLLFLLEGRVAEIPPPCSRPTRVMFLYLHVGRMQWTPFDRNIILFKHKNAPVKCLYRYVNQQRAEHPNREDFVRRRFISETSRDLGGFDQKNTNGLYL